VDFGETMDNWRIIGKIASLFGIISVIFAAFAGLLNFELNTYLYPPVTGFQILSVLEAMLPFLFVAVFSFALSGIVRANLKEKIKPTAVPEDVEPEPEAASAEEPKP
jgi:hypothetical protein